MIKVVLEYDSVNSKWDPYVEGAETSFEARDAFRAAVVTMQMLDENLLPLAMTRPVNGRYRIIPGVTPGSMVQKASGDFTEGK